MNEITPTIDVAETAGAPLAPLPEDVARVLGHLANLIDGSLSVRGVGNDIRGFAAGFLRTASNEVASTVRYLDTLDFQAFLVTLDGALSRNRAIVTIATTNAPGAIDPAARRAARFDRILDVPLPDRTARAHILRRYLDRLDGEVDVDPAVVAATTDGWSGAALRALVGEAVLHAAGGAVTTDLLVQVARRDEAAHRLPGAYL